MLWFNIEQVYRTLILYIFYKFILFIINYLYIGI